MAIGVAAIFAALAIEVRLGNRTHQANDLTERALERRGKRHALSEALIRTEFRRLT